MSDTGHGTIALDPADFWKLRALIREEELAAIRLARARAAITTHHDVIAMKYPAFVHNVAYRLMDDTCSLVDATRGERVLPP